jgi:maltooligosyltrehalose trehalohydrolase
MFWSYNHAVGIQGHPDGRKGVLNKKSGWKLSIGASVISAGVVRFRVWAPGTQTVSVKVPSRRPALTMLEQDRWGYFQASVEDVREDDQYFYVIDETVERPDPASRFQPRGIHSPSQIVNPDGFLWQDAQWTGISLENYIIYELHVGTFTDEGRFESIIPRLDYLVDLGITAIELMPVAQFSGNRNWGYDSVYPFAPQNSYGGPIGLKRLIDACHAKGLAVILDVVYNHLGPEGNYFRDFSPWYFTDKYKTPWGDGINFDGPNSDYVRYYFIDNALYWIIEYHIDALRVDAVHGIFDFGAEHFLKELAAAVHRFSVVSERKVYVMAESDLNDVRIIKPPQRGGYGVDAQWNDDFHHALHCLITGEQQGYYQDFGKLGQMRKALSDGFVYSGQYSQFRKRRHGNSSKTRPASQFVVSIQNHDQVGNRGNSERLSQTQSLEKLKLAAGVVLLSPYLPLLFMGEEYGEKAPFHYFTSFSDETLAMAVRTGRQSEFVLFGEKGSVRDPQDEALFLESKISPWCDKSARQTALLRFYTELMRLRKTNGALKNLSKEHMRIHKFDNEKVLMVRRWSGEEQILCFYSFNQGIQTIPVTTPGRWIKAVDSSLTIWGGDGPAAPEEIWSNGAACPVTLAPFSLAGYQTEQGIGA